MRTRRRRYSTLRTKFAYCGAGPARLEASIRLDLDGGGHVTKGSVTIPKRIPMSETAFRLTVADQLRQLAEQIAGANRDDLLNPLAWPLVQFDPPPRELKKV